MVSVHVIGCDWVTKVILQRPRITREKSSEPTHREKSGDCHRSLLLFIVFQTETVHGLGSHRTPLKKSL